MWAARLERHLAGDVLAEARGQHVADDRFLDDAGLDSGALDGFLRGDDAEFHSRKTGQGAAEGSDGGAGGTYDDYFTHGFLWGMGMVHQDG